MLALKKIENKQIARHNNYSLNGLMVVLIKLDILFQGRWITSLY